MFIIEIWELMLVLKVMLRNWVYCRFRKGFISQKERLDMGIREFSWVNWEIRYNDSNYLKSRQTGSGCPNIQPLSFASDSAFCSHIVLRSY